MDNINKYLGEIIKVIIDRPLGSEHPDYDLVYPVNYGYIPNTEAPDGEEIDAYVLGVAEPLKEFTGKCIAIIQRLNDNDDKLVVVPERVCYSDRQIRKLTDFQEKYFKNKIVTISKR